MKRIICFLIFLSTISVLPVSTSAKEDEKYISPRAISSSQLCDSTAAISYADAVPCESDYIKWIDFTPSSAALSYALELDIKTHDSSAHLDWVELLACLATKYGGNFSHFSKSDADAVLEKYKSGTAVADQVSNKKLYQYYLEAYGAVIGGMVGDFTRVKVAQDGTETCTEEYGLRAFSPIASGYGYSDYDDFGVSRSYGYRRRHLGHDMMGSVGTPIIAVESGYVEVAGWNQYGGWRVGIRSFDGKRYYYYAHLRRDHPFCDMYEGKIVNAGEVIGYLGMTGYSARENVNNIDTPHLHFGLEIIFDPSQKDGYNQIWVDLLAICDTLKENRSQTYRSGKEAYSRVYYVYPETPD